MVPHKQMQPGDSAGHKYTEWVATIDTKRTTVEDLFRPQYWIACLNLKTNDLIRCVADDGSYDFMLKVNTHQVTANKNGVTVSLWPRITPDVLAAAETAASEMVPTVMNGKPVPRVEPIANGKWRLIGFDGQPVGSVLSNEAFAAKAYDDYIAAHGITHEIEQPAIDAKTGAVVAAKTTPEIGDRPGQFSIGKRKEIEKRQKVLAKRAEIDAKNKARTAERIAAEAAASNAA